MLGENMRIFLKLNYDNPVVQTWTVDGALTEFDNLETFLNTKIRECSVYVTTKNWTAIKRYMIEHHKKELSINYVDNRTKEKEYSFTVFKDERARKKTFHDIKYKTGTDRYETLDDFLLAIKNAPSTAKSGFTSILAKELETDEQMLKWTLEDKMIPSLAPMIFAKPGREFSNVKCFDITSFYPYLMTQELPHYVKYVRANKMDLSDRRYCYYGAIFVTNLKPKNCLINLGIHTNKHGKPDLDDKVSEDVVTRGSKIIKAKRLKLCGFIHFLLDAIEDYSYDTLTFGKGFFKFELKQNDKVRNWVLQKFETKQVKKRNGENYEAEKIKLNRGDGFFIMRNSNRERPVHFGWYVVAKAHNIMSKLCHMIGSRDLVHCHTDSLKFIGNHEDVIKFWNDSIEFQELGKFVQEQTFDRCLYYKICLAKYEIDGVLDFKHGGIEYDNIEPLLKLTYDEVNENTTYFLTKAVRYDLEKGLIEYGNRKRLIDKF